MGSEAGVLVPPRGILSSEIPAARLALELLAIQVVIQALLCHEAIVVTRLHHDALIQHYYDVCIAHRTQTVRDDNRRSIAEDVVQIVLNGTLALDVQRAGCLVEDQYPR